MPLFPETPVRPEQAENKRDARSVSGSWMRAVPGNTAGAQELLSFAKRFSAAAITSPHRRNLLLKVKLDSKHEASLASSCLEAIEERGKQVGGLRVAVFLAQSAASYNALTPESSMGT